MKKGIMKRWVKALRSGKFKQEQGALYRDGGYCCLGVLCRLHAQENNNRFKNTSNGRRGIYLGSCSFLPERVSEWAGLKHTRPHSANGQSLTALNDGGKGFDYIADIIEKDYKGI